MSNGCGETVWTFYIDDKLKRIEFFLKIFIVMNKI